MSVPILRSALQTWYFQNPTCCASASLLPCTSIAGIYRTLLDHTSTGARTTRPAGPSLGGACGVARRGRVRVAISFSVALYNAHVSVSVQASGPGYASLQNYYALAQARVELQQDAHVFCVLCKVNSRWRGRSEYSSMVLVWQRVEHCCVHPPCCKVAASPGTSRNSVCFSSLYTGSTLLVRSWTSFETMQEAFTKIGLL